MNSKLLLTLACAAGLTASAAHAQVFGPETSRNVLLGGIVGAIVGDNHHHQAAAGAVIGATAGLIWSQATGADDGACRPAPAQRSVRVIPAQPCPNEEVVVVRQDCPPPVQVVYIPEHPQHRHGHYERVVYIHGNGYREVRTVFVEDRRRDRDCDDDRDNHRRGRW
jgi:hypothetical protein